MKISDKISVRRIVEQCQLNGISDIVISPGSRNAPFIISFTNNPYFNCYSIVDERSASHFALGIAQQKKKPVAIVSTSGTATLNYTSAVAESHFQGIPLLVITADRQSNGLEIGDGQVINQKGIYQNFCENNYNIIEDENDTEELNSANIQEAFFGLIYNKKTVHLNVQLSEPLYGVQEISPIKNTAENDIPDLRLLPDERITKLKEKWNSYSNKIILVTQHDYFNLESEIKKITGKDNSLVVVTETTGNVIYPDFVGCIDRTIELIDKNNPLDFIPDLIVTIGHSVISKKIKQLFRTHKPKEHWSFSRVRNENLFELNSFESFAELIDFDLLNQAKQESDFKLKWDSIRIKGEQNHLDCLAQTTFSDLKAFEYLTQNLPTCNLQMGNSSVVRYIQLFNQRSDIQYNSNRGVSGIEGCTSTALGAHQVTNNTILISGDVSFLYDSNAFWNNHIPSNFKVIVINNGEGNIFKILPHPQKDETSLPFFTTPHKTSIKKFCDLYELAHLKVDSIESLDREFPKFIENNRQASVLEIDTSKVDNDTILKEYFNFLKQNNYGNNRNGK